MRVVVPFAANRPKTRLSSTLSAGEREAFAVSMLRDVLRAITDAGHDPEVLATAPVEVEVPVTVDDRPLTPAVNAAIADPPVAVVMADLPLVTPDAIDRLFGPAADVVLAPGRGGGTNALVSRTPAFRVDYHGASYRDHREIADGVGAGVAEVDSFRLSTDVDEPADLAEVLLHGTGEARRWLVDAGFRVTVRDGRVGIDRE